MKAVFWKIVRRLLYFTPIGYVLSLFDLHLGKATPGVYVHLPQYTPPKVFVKKNYLPKDRFDWFFNGSVLLAQAGFAVSSNLMNPTSVEEIQILLSMFIWTALLFGIVNIITALFPKVSWEKRIIPFLDFNWLWLVILSTMVIGAILTFAPESLQSL